MKVFEIKNFAKGYDDSLSSEYAPVESSQDSRWIDYTRTPGAISRAFGDGLTSYSNQDRFNAPITANDLDTAGTTSTGVKVQAIYEGRIDVSGTGKWTLKRCLVAGGMAWQFCPGDVVIPLGSRTQLFDEDDLIDITHYIGNFYFAGGYDYAIRSWNGLSNDMALATGLSTGNLLYRAKYINVYKYRLIIANTYESTDGGATWTAYPNRVRWSDIDQPTLWDTSEDSASDASYTDINDKDGDQIVRIMPYGDSLFVFKRNSIYKLVSTGGDLIYERVQIDPNAVNNNGWSVTPVPGGLAVLNSEGIQLVNEENVAQLEPSGKIDGLITRCWDNTLHEVVGCTDETRKEYHLVMPIDGSITAPQNIGMITWNWKYNTWRYLHQLGVGAHNGLSSIGIFTEDIHQSNVGQRTLMIGRDGGELTKFGSAFISQLGYAQAIHITPWIDFGTPGEYKEVLKVQPKWSGDATVEVQVSYQADGDTSWTALPTDAFDSDDVIEQPILPMRALGRKFRFRISHVPTSEIADFTVYSMKIFYIERSLR